ncbi:hypothetical protein BH11PLA1_BH11PLA1_20430 [soil metagenome]
MPAKKPSLPTHSFTRAGFVCAFAAAGTLAICAALAGCRKAEVKTSALYSQATPQAVLDSMLTMMKAGDVKRLPDLVYAESKEYRIILNRVGSLMERMKELTVAVTARFPAEAAALKGKVQELTRLGSLEQFTQNPDVKMLTGAQRDVKAAKAAAAASSEDPAAKKGTAKTRTPGSFSIGLGGKNGIQIGAEPPGGKPIKPGISITTTTGEDKPAVAAPGPAAKPTGDEPAQAQADMDSARNAQRDALQSIMDQLLADPFAILEENAKRLTVEMIADDQAAVLFDGAPVPPLGLTMRKENDAWFIQLPSNIPGVDRFLPETRNEWSILGSLITSIANAVKDLRDDVNAGKVRRVDDLAEKAGEKAFVPVAMCAVVYAKEMDARMQRQRAMGDLKPRLTKWLAARKSQGEEAAVNEKLAVLVNKAAIEGLDLLVRAERRDPAQKLPKWSAMGDGELQGVVEGWVDAREKTHINLNVGSDRAKIEAAHAQLSDLVNVQK